MKLSPISYFTNMQSHYAKAKVANFTQNNKHITFGQEHDFFERALENETKSTQPQNISSSKSQKSEIEDTVLDNALIRGMYNESDSTVGEILTTAGVVGVPFLLIIATTNFLTKNIQPEELFSASGEYLGNVADYKIKDDQIKVDIKDGTLKIDGTGVNLDKSRYDEGLSNPEKGIFKSADGKLDIDLAHNKYIDQANGIIVDPDAKISAFTTADGELKNIPLPNFGSGYPTNPWTDGGLPLPSYDYGPHPIYDALAQIRDFFFGNKDSELDTRVKDYLAENNINSDTAVDIIKYADDIRLKEYMLDNFPDLADKVNIGSIDKFIENIHEQGVNYDEANGLIDIINNDNPNPDII